MISVRMIKYERGDTAVFTIPSNASRKSVSSGCGVVSNPGIERDVPMTLAVRMQPAPRVLDQASIPKSNSLVTV
ncbi:hypothetical protein PISMIDRAFT_533173 [Pisolithus microcarpus 441]|uniref:Uncharacterized protein n=1 Tax=Pisolithus microcarpus 441 TaxID=765257 RepID=A0A0C9XFN2_9AGAM|nr:hypothetical protein PISMIDRAFT_533173 [Pisolithus microcarpus 441]